MDPYTVVEPKSKGGFWSHVNKGLNAAIGKKFLDLRGGQLLDAIAYRTNYLRDHPGEKAIIIVATEPTHHRVTAATTVFTDAGRLYASSAALGNHMRLAGFTAADIDATDRIRKELQDRRDTYLEAAGVLNEAHASIAALDVPQVAAGIAPGDAVTLESNSLVPIGIVMARAEETGDYSGIQTSNQYGLQDDFVGGDPKELMDVACDVLRSTTNLPIARAKLMLNKVSPDNPTVPTVGLEDLVVFDWDDVHYIFNPDLGTYGIPIPKNLVTGIPALVLKHGDILESLYFVATFRLVHPEEGAKYLPAADGEHAGAAYTLNGHLWIYSPTCGRFVLPPRYKPDDVSGLTALHARLVTKFLASTKGAARVNVDEMPGDTADLQTRRAALALTRVGFTCKLESAQGRPVLTVSWPGATYVYTAPDESSFARPIVPARSRH